MTQSHLPRRQEVLLTAAVAMLQPKNCPFFSSITNAETVIFTFALQSLGVRHTVVHIIFSRCSNITNVFIAHHDPVQTSIGFHLIPFEQFALLGGLARLTPRSLTEQSHHSWANLRAKSMLIAPVLKRIPLFISHCFPVLFLTRGSFAVIQVNFQQENSHGDNCGGGTEQTYVDSVQVYTLFLSSSKCCCQQPVATVLATKGEFCNRKTEVHTQVQITAVDTAPSATVHVCTLRFWRAGLAVAAASSKPVPAILQTIQLET